MLSSAKLPFAIHAAIETAAAVSFILRPGTQLAPLSPAAALILQSKGGLLLFSNLICVIFLGRPVDGTTRLVALSFAFWHLFPCHRALVRMRAPVDGETAEQRRTLGGPVVHLGVHLAVFGSFLAAGLSSG